MGLVKTRPTRPSTLPRRAGVASYRAGIIQPDSMHPMETAPVPTRLLSLDSYEMHIYSVHNAGRAVFALSIRRAAVTLVVFTICAAACSAAAEQVLSA